MMKKWKVFILVVCMLALFAPTTAFAKEPFEDKVVFGGTFTLESGETHNGSLVIFGGAVTIESESTVNGDVVLLGGTVEVGGDVNGSLVGIGGSVRLRETAVVNGDLITIGAALRREEGAEIYGEVTDGMNMPFNFTIPDDAGVNGAHPPKPPVVSVNTNPFLQMIWFFFRVFMYAALAVLMVMFFSTQTERVTRAALSQPVITGGAGLLTAVLAPLALVAITITIILIPVTLVAVILLFVAWLMGWVALGLEVGRRIAKSLKQDWAPAICAGIGTFTILFVLGGFKQIIPCIGWLPQLLVGIWGLGAVLLTRFGTQEYTSFEADTANAVPPVLVDESSPVVIVDLDDDTEEIEADADQDEKPIPSDDLSLDEDPPKSDE